MVSRRTFWIGLILVIGLLTLAACGGSKEEPTPTVPAPATQEVEEVQAEEPATEEAQTEATGGEEEATADADAGTDAGTDTVADDGHTDDAAAADTEADDGHMDDEADHAADEVADEDHEATDDHGVEGEHEDEAASPMHAHVEVPDDYAHLENPGADDEAFATAGQALFEVNCASCHGPEGAGDGPAAVALDPQPANLGDAAMMDTLSDAYLFWRVSEGGGMEPFNSAMPAWKFFSEEQRWQLVNYIRTFTEATP